MRAKLTPSSKGIGREPSKFSAIRGRCVRQRGIPDNEAVVCTGHGRELALVRSNDAHRDPAAFRCNPRMAAGGTGPPNAFPEDALQYVPRRGWRREDRRK